MDKVYYGTMETLIGKLAIAKTAKGICWLTFVGEAEEQRAELDTWLAKHLPQAIAIKDEQALQAEKEELEAYFKGEAQQFHAALDLQGTSFQKSVWQALQEIPYGEVRSYKQIAEAVGSPKAVRAVGGANNKNPIAIIVPCHRVIGANGSLVGYGGGLSMKKKLLQLEGILIKEDVS